MNMKSIQLIAVPYHLDKERVGMGCGPEAYLQHGVEKILKDAGHAVSTEILQQKEPVTNQIDFILALQKQVAARVSAALQRNQFPFILSGNCNSSIGVIGGMSSQPLGLIWFDAHGDFNTPATSPSGFFDGMSIAVIAGLCYDEFAKTLGGCLPLPASRFVHLGGRDFDAEELDNLQKSDVTLIPAAQIQQAGASEAVKPALKNLAEKTPAVHLHLDIDVLNSQDYPANEFPAPGGLSPEELQSAIDVIGQSLSIRSATISAYNPAYDPTGKTLRAGLRLIHRIVENIT